MKTLFDKQIQMLDAASLMAITGRVTDVAGLVVAVEGLPLPLGAACTIHPARRPCVEAQVIGFRGDRTLLLPLSDPLGTASGDSVTSAPMLNTVAVSDEMLGRVFNGLGRPIDGKEPINAKDAYPIYKSAPPAFSRRAIEQPISTGVRSIDAMLTLGLGQRIGLFAGTGVGKSVLMGMITRNTDADVVVVGLVGERGREVGDFIRKDLGEEGLKKCVMVVSTSDESPVLRVRAGLVATSVAEYFRDQGANVLLLMDSVTRVAMALRQIGLAAGEPPVSKGYPPSVFSALPAMLERAGSTERGSITGIYTVLVEGDDINEPVADAVRGILDGHVLLSRDLANAAHYPAVAVLESISRVMVDVADEEQMLAARSVRRVMAVWKDIEDLVNIGAYAKGTTPAYDIAIEMKPLIDAFLQQAVNEASDHESARAQLLALHREIQSAEAAANRVVMSPAELQEVAAK